MTRILKVAFCVLTLLGAVSLTGCSEQGAAPADPSATTETPAETPAETEAAPDSPEE